MKWYELVASANQFKQRLPCIAVCMADKLEIEFIPIAQKDGNTFESFQMSTQDIKNLPKIRGKKPKMQIYCCDISIRNELAIGHETGDVSLWKLDLEM